MKKLLSKLPWSIRCMICFRVDRLAYWLIVQSHMLYNFGLSEPAKFPTELVPDKIAQGLRWRLKQAQCRDNHNFNTPE